MQIASFSNNTRKRSAIGLTSLIDVVFILLLFFMLSSTFSPVRALDVNSVTHGAGEPLSEQKPLLINVLDADRWRVDGVVMSHLESSSIVARAASENIAVLVRAEGSASVQALVTALSFLERQGIHNLNVGNAVKGGSGDV